MTSCSEEFPPTWDNFITSTHFTPQIKARIAREVLVINSNWGVNWRATLRAGGINIQDEPSYQLALSLARLAAFQPDISRLLATLPTFRSHQSAQAPVAGKRVDPRTSSLFGTVEQRIAYNSYRVLNSWMDFLTNPNLPPSVTTRRSGRAAAREAAKRGAPTSPANSSRRRCVCTSSVSIERGRSRATATEDTSEIWPQEEPTLPHSELEDTGVDLDSDEELSLSSPVPDNSSAHERSTQSPPKMARDVAHLLEDPLWRAITKCLSETRKQTADLRVKVAEAEALLSQVQEENERVLTNIGVELGVEKEMTPSFLEEAIGKFETDLKAEEELREFLTTHRVEYRRLATASTSASNNVNALDTTDADQAIAELTSKIEVYEAAKNVLQEAETAVSNAVEAQRNSIQALAADEKRRTTFQELAKTMNSDFAINVIDEELAKL